MLDRIAIPLLVYRPSDLPAPHGASPRAHRWARTRNRSTIAGGKNHGTRMSRHPPPSPHCRRAQERASGCFPTLKPCKAHLSRGIYRKSRSSATTAHARNTFPRAALGSEPGGATQRHRRRLRRLLARRFVLGYPKFENCQRSGRNRAGREPGGRRRLAGAGREQITGGEPPRELARAIGSAGYAACCRLHTTPRVGLGSDSVAASPRACPTLSRAALRAPPARLPARPAGPLRQRKRPVAALGHGRPAPRATRGSAGSPRRTRARLSMSTAQPPTSVIDEAEVGAQAASLQPRSTRVEGHERADPVGQAPRSRGGSATPARCMSSVEEEDAQAARSLAGASRRAERCCRTPSGGGARTSPRCSGGCRCARASPGAGCSGGSDPRAG